MKLLNNLPIFWKCQQKRLNLRNFPHFILKAEFICMMKKFNAPTKLNICLSCKARKVQDMFASWQKCNKRTKRRARCLPPQSTSLKMCSIKTWIQCELLTVAPFFSDLSAEFFFISFIISLSYDSFITLSRTKIVTVNFIKNFNH